MVRAGSPMKTVRFAELVAKAGAPEAHQMWVPPAKDAAFQRALKAHRVLTVHQENVGTKKDYGVVGFHEEPHAQFLVFPKSLREFEGRRVVGVKYELLAADSRPASSRQAASTTENPEPAPPRKQATAGRSRESRTIVSFEPPPAAVALRTAEDSPERRAAPTRLAAVEPQPVQTPRERRLLAGVTRALRELETGKSIAAYKRLQQLVDAGTGKRRD